MQVSVFRASSEAIGTFSVRKFEEISAGLAQLALSDPIGPYDYIECSGNTWTLVPGKDGLIFMHGRHSPQSRKNEEIEIIQAPPRVPNHTPTVCNQCGHPMNVPDLYAGRAVKCTSCRSEFTARPFAEAVEARMAFVTARQEAEAQVLAQQASEKEQLRLDRLTHIRELLIDAGGSHYLDIERRDRDDIEAVIAELLEAGQYRWGRVESDIIKLAVQIQGRSELLAMNHQRRVEELLTQAVHATIGLQTAISEATSVIATRLESIRQGTTTSGLAAARVLGSQYSEG